MTKQHWENEVEKYAIMFDWETIVEKNIKDLIRAEIKENVEETKRRCIEALIQFAEPYEGAKWLNVLSPDDIKNIINNV